MAPLCMGFLRQESSGLPFHSPGDLPDTGMEPTSPALSGTFFTTQPPARPRTILETVKTQLTESSVKVGRSVGGRLTPFDTQSVSQFSCSVLSDSLWPHGLQYTRPPCPSPTPGVHQSHVHRVGDAIQPSHPLLSLSPPALNLSQHQGLFKWVSSSHQVAKVLEFQLQHQSFQWTFRTDLL